MMMNVSVRCNHVGVAMSEHIDQMSAGHTTMFQEAHNRVRAYLMAARAGLSAPVAKGKDAATSRRSDPLDRYITMAGNRYGGGSTTPDRCHAFEAIALSLAEQGNTDRLLRMVADSLIAQTMLESITSCAAKP